MQITGTERGHSTLWGRIIDNVLLALWIFGYAALLWTFKIVRRAELSAATIAPPDVE